MKRFDVDGMTCGGCVNSVTRALEHAGFTAVVDLDSASAEVEGEPDEARVIAVIEDAGFTARTSEASA